MLYVVVVVVPLEQQHGMHEARRRRRRTADERDKCFLVHLLSFVLSGALHTFPKSKMNQLAQQKVLLKFDSHAWLKLADLQILLLQPTTQARRQACRLFLFRILKDNFILILNNPAKYVWEWVY